MGGSFLCLVWPLAWNFVIHICFSQWNMEACFSKHQHRFPVVILGLVSESVNCCLPLSVATRVFVESQIAEGQDRPWSIGRGVLGVSLSGAPSSSFLDLDFFTHHRRVAWIHFHLKAHTNFKATLAILMNRQLFSQPQDGRPSHWHLGWGRGPSL